MESSEGSPGASRAALSAGDNESATSLLQEKKSTRRDHLSDVTRVEYITVSILCFVNLINYMDRFTLAAKFLKAGKLFLFNSLGSHMLFALSLKF